MCLISCTLLALLPFHFFLLCHQPRNITIIALLLKWDVLEIGGKKRANYANG